MHWGTFALTDEPLDEPPRRLAEALDAAGLDRARFWVFEHGETRDIAPRTEHTVAKGAGPAMPPVEVSSGQANFTSRP